MVCVYSTATVLGDLQDSAALDLNILLSSGSLADLGADGVPLDQADHDRSDLFRPHKVVLGHVQHGQLVRVLHEQRSFNDTGGDSCDPDTSLVEPSKSPDNATGRVLGCVVDGSGQACILRIGSGDDDNGLCP